MLIIFSPFRVNRNLYNFRVDRGLWLHCYVASRTILPITSATAKLGSSKGRHRLRSCDGTGWPSNKHATSYVNAYTNNASWINNASWMTKLNNLRIFQIRGKTWLTSVHGCLLVNGSSRMLTAETGARKCLIISHLFSILIFFVEPWTATNKKMW